MELLQQSNLGTICIATSTAKWIIDHHGIMVDHFGPRDPQGTAWYGTAQEICFGFALKKYQEIVSATGDKCLPPLPGMAHFPTSDAGRLEQ